MISETVRLQIKRNCDGQTPKDLVVAKELRVKFLRNYEIVRLTTQQNNRVV